MLRQHIYKDVSKWFNEKDKQNTFPMMVIQNKVKIEGCLKEGRGAGSPSQGLNKQDKQENGFQTLLSISEKALMGSGR